jgi:hypothetical protein
MAPHEMAVLPAKEAELIFRASFLCLFSVASAMYFNQTQLAFVPLSVFLTSILHWSRPVL